MADIRAVVGQEGLRNESFDAGPVRIIRREVFKLAGSGVLGRAAGPRKQVAAECPLQW
jgi:hypothetical protein